MASRRCATLPVSRSHGTKTATYGALGHVFAVRASIAPLRKHLERVFASLTVAQAPTTVYEIGTTDTGGVHLSVRDRLIVDELDRTRALAHLLWDVNRSAVQRTPDLVLLHAAAVAHGHRAVVLPAAMESGKSTLAVALVRSGLDYVTDEIVGIQPATGAVVPYPRAISLDPGSWVLFPDLRPDVDPAAEAYIPLQWQLPPTEIPGARVAGWCRPDVLVFPHYQQGARTQLVPLGPNETLVALAEATFEFAERASNVLGPLHRLAHACAGYRLTVGDHLEHAVRIVRSLLAA